MPSKTRATRESQKNLCERRLKERRDVLEKRGVAPKDFSKDKVYEHLKAQKKSIDKAIAAIDDSEKRNERKAPAEEPKAKDTAPEQAPKEKKPKKDKPKKAEKKEE